MAEYFVYTQYAGPGVGSKVAVTDTTPLPVILSGAASSGGVSVPLPVPSTGVITPVTIPQFAITDPDGVRFYAEMFSDRRSLKQILKVLTNIQDILMYQNQYFIPDVDASETEY